MASLEWDIRDPMSSNCSPQERKPKRRSFPTKEHHFPVKYDCCGVPHAREALIKMYFLWVLWTKQNTTNPKISNWRLWGCIKHQKGWEFQESLEIFRRADAVVRHSVPKTSCDGVDSKEVSGNSFYDRVSPCFTCKKDILSKEPPAADLWLFWDSSLHTLEGQCLKMSSNLTLHGHCSEFLPKWFQVGPKEP